MVTLTDYFAGWPDDPGINDTMRDNATKLLDAVNLLLAASQDAGLYLLLNPRTASMVAGVRNGGWRPSECLEGAQDSAHKQGRAIDVYDPCNHLDFWLTDAMLEAYGLYRESPQATMGWCHLTDRAPPSGHRTFFP